MNKKNSLLMLVLICVLLFSVGCGRRMNGATDGTNKKPQNTQDTTVEDKYNDTTTNDNVVDGVVNGVDDTVDGVMNGVEDTMDGVMNTTDDLVDGIDDTPIKENNPVDNTTTKTTP